MGLEATVERRLDVRPAWPFRLGGGTPEGLLRRHGDGVHRILHVHGERVHVAARQAPDGRVVLGARASSDAAAQAGLDRMRFGLGLDDDLREFHERFGGDPVIGRAVRALPHLRAFRRPDPWEALVCAITEQLIEFERAVAIQRRLIAALGPRCPRSGLRDMPDTAVLAGVAPAQLCAWDLAEVRALSLRAAARLVARGSIVLSGDGTEACRRLRAVPGIGPWTVECVALFGFGRLDVVPAMDLGYVKLVGRLLTGRPRARADEDAVRGFFSAYDPWAGLAARYLTVAAARGWLPERVSAVSRPAPRAPVPVPAGRRPSPPPPRALAA